MLLSLADLILQDTISGHQQETRLLQQYCSEYYGPWLSKVNLLTELRKSRPPAFR